MEKILLVARNVFRAILHRRILYLWLAAIGFLVLRSSVPIFFNFGNEALQTVMRRRAVSGALDTWSTLCIALAMFLGASVISGEISGKTIVTVLARPIRRWEFLIGKWIGVQAFALLSLILGLVVSLGLARYLGADFEPRILYISLAQTAVAVSLYSALAIALGTLVTPGVAGALAVLVAFLPGFVTFLVESPNSVNRGVGVVLDYVVPPGYTSHYTATISAPIPFDAIDLRRGRANRRGGVPPFLQTAPEPEIDYDTESWALIQNLGYGLVFFSLGGIVFSRRDLRLN